MMHLLIDRLTDVSPVLFVEFKCNAVDANPMFSDPLMLVKI